mmetsp:Transcript_66048/g.193306  ORF Transcript_66048/g.193306 Transcript_66048/m.193306 type:complete len:365 (-) Transcript_66048:84-1178(-)
MHQAGLPGQAPRTAADHRGLPPAALLLRRVGLLRPPRRHLGPELGLLAIGGPLPAGPRLLAPGVRVGARRRVAHDDAGLRLLLLLRLLRRRREHGEAELGRLVARVDAPLALAPRLLRELHEDVRHGLRVLRQLGRDDGVGLGDGHRVLHQVHELGGRGRAEEARVQLLAEVPAVVVRQVGFRDSWAVGVINILLECPQQEEQLEAQSHQGPIFKHEACKERLPSADVTDIIDSEYINCGNLNIFFNLVILLCFVLSSNSFLLTLAPISINFLGTAVLLCPLSFLWCHILIAFLCAPTLIPLLCWPLLCVFLVILVLLVLLLLLSLLLHLPHSELGSLCSSRVLSELLLLHLPLLQDSLPFGQP